MDLKLNRKNLTPDQRDKLEAWESQRKQVQTLEDIASMFQEFFDNDDKTKKTYSKDTEKLGALLVDVREQLLSLNKREDPQMPDYAKPVTEAIGKLETALKAAIEGIEVRPEVSVSPTKVNVPTPQVKVETDLSGVERIFKTLPKAFKDAIDSIPKVDIPEADYTPLIEKWDDISTKLSEKLEDIDRGVRMKPIPGSMAISNLSEQGLGIPLYDYLSVAYPNTTTEVYTFYDGGPVGTVLNTLTLTYVDDTKEELSTVARV